MLPLVSVIIPCYNDYLYIQEALDSINNQDYENIEIIIIDDGSDQITKDVLVKIVQENLQIIYQENKGTSVARNNGIKKAKGEFILTLDADDYFESTFISKGMQLLVQNSNLGLISCWFKIFNNKGVLENFKPKGGDMNTLIFYNGTSGGSALFRKKCWSDIDGYDEMMRSGFEDWEFNISIAKAGWGIYIIEEELFNYREKENSRNKKANEFHKYELWKYIYIKHKDLWINNFDEMINNTLSQMESLESCTHNLRKTIDYKIGNVILKPFRFIKYKFISSKK